MINRIRHRTPLVAAAMVIGLLAPACGTDADNASTAPPTASQSDQPAPTMDTAVAVPETLQFTAPLVGGGEFIGADYAGKPTVFWFWAPT